MFTSPTSSTGAIMFEIIILMLVAAIIGFAIAYLMFKNRWKAGRMLLEGEIAQIRDQLEMAQSEASKFNQNWSESKKKVNQLENAIKKGEKQQEELKMELQTKAAETARLSAEIERLKEEKALSEEKLKSYSDYNEVKAELESCKIAWEELTQAYTACQEKLNTRGGVLPPETAGKKKKLTKEEQLAKVAARKDTLNFARIGTATEKDRQDLKRIGGIGPFIEAKLNALGIFTYRQIGNFDAEDKQQVNEAIEFFPGRIERDDWVGQALEFVKEETKSDP